MMFIRAFSLYLAAYQGPNLRRAEGMQGMKQGECRNRFKEFFVAHASMAYMDGCVGTSVLRA